MDPRGRLSFIILPRSLWIAFSRGVGWDYSIWPECPAFEELKAFGKAKRDIRPVRSSIGDSPSEWNPNFVEEGVDSILFSLFLSRFEFLFPFALPRACSIHEMEYSLNVWISLFIFWFEVYFSVKVDNQFFRLFSMLNNHAQWSSDVETKDREIARDTDFICNGKTLKSVVFGYLKNKII